MSIISIGQIIVSVLIIVLILIQERSSGLSGIFGGGGGDGGFYQARRGLEKIIFYSTVSLIVDFIVLAILNLVL